MTEVVIATEPKTGARPFDDADWQCWSGAEEWDADHGPVVREMNNCAQEKNEYPAVIIADAQSVQVMMYAEEGYTDCVGFMNVAFPTQHAAMAFLNGLPEGFNPELYGFELY